MVFKTSHKYFADKIDNIFYTWCMQQDSSRCCRITLAKMEGLQQPEESGTSSAPALVHGPGLLDAIMIVIGSMIGSGIFLTSTESARLVGAPGWLLVAWMLAGVLTITGTLCCAELAAMMLHAGGQYVFLSKAYSPLVGFLFGWALFLVVQTGTIAAVAVAFANFLGMLLPPERTLPRSLLLSCGTVIALYLLANVV